MISALLLSLMAQASSADLSALDAYLPPATVEEDRLTLCLGEATSDPSNAIVTASTWLAEAHDAAERSFPQQCLGMAYTRLLRWSAAEQAFLDARNGTLEWNQTVRGRLAAMAGNSALAEGRAEDALASFTLAEQDAAKAGDKLLAGEVQVDRSRALVALDHTAEADAALANARRDAPQNSDAWLLSATLARRTGDLERAQGQIATAAGLDPTNPLIGLEAGVIAVLGGRDDAARQSWQSVIELAPDSAEAKTARGYLKQLEEPQS